MTRRKPLPTDFAELPFSRQTATAAGITDRRLRASDLSRPFHGVRHGVDYPEQIEWICRAYQERMPRRQLFSHDTAARLYGLPLPLYLGNGSRLHVSVSTPQHPPSGRRVIGHEIADALWDPREIIYQDHERGHLFAIPVVAPAMAWAQLASALDPDDLVALGDAIVTGESPLGTMDELRRAIRMWGARRGARSMTCAIDQVRVGSLSRPESLQRLQLMRAGIPEPELNIEVTDQQGQPISMADFSWPQYRVVLEYEGDGHRTSRGKFRSDITRGERYADGGWFPMRSYADDVFSDPNPLIARVARRLRERGWPSSPIELRQIAAARR